MGDDHHQLEVVVVEARFLKDVCYPQINVKIMDNSKKVKSQYRTSTSNYESRCHSFNEMFILTASDPYSVIKMTPHHFLNSISRINFFFLWKSLDC